VSEFDDTQWWADYGDALKDEGILLAHEEWDITRFVRAIEIARELGRAEQPRAPELPDMHNASAFERLDAIQGLVNETQKRVAAHRWMAKLEEERAENATRERGSE